MIEMEFTYDFDNTFGSGGILSFANIFCICLVVMFLLKFIRHLFACGRRENKDLLSRGFGFAKSKTRKSIRKSRRRRSKSNSKTRKPVRKSRRRKSNPKTRKSVRKSRRRRSKSKSKTRKSVRKSRRRRSKSKIKVSKSIRK